MPRTVAKARIDDLKSALTQFIDLHTLTEEQGVGMVRGSHNYMADDIFKKRKFLLANKIPFWKEIVSDKSENVCVKRVEVLNAVITSLITEFEYKPEHSFLCLAIIKQLKGEGFDFIAGQSGQAKKEGWRNWLANLSNNVSQFHTQERLKSSQFGLDDRDVVWLWRSVALLWNRDNPVGLHTPVGNMVQAGAWLAQAGLLEVNDLNDLWPEFLTNMENRAKGNWIRKVMLGRGVDPEILDGILSLSMKKHLTEVAEKHRQDQDEDLGSARMKIKF